MAQDTEVPAKTRQRPGKRSQGLLPMDRVIQILRTNTLNTLGVTYVLGLPTQEGISLGQGNADDRMAVVVLSAALAGLGAKPHYDKFVRNESRFSNPSQRQGMTSAQSMLRKLRQTGLVFVMVWHVRGLLGVHIDCSRGFDRNLLEPFLLTMANGLADGARGRVYRSAAGT